MLMQLRSTQEIILKAFKGLCRFPQEATFSIWLMEISANETEVAQRPAQLAGNPIRSFGAERTAKALARALDSLPEKTAPH
jgi:DNA-directed RNA polymerase specialized sigma24 family protein